MDASNTFGWVSVTDGVNQLQRSLPALDPDSILLDERSTREFLVFLLALSDEIRFYNQKNQTEGGWRPLFDWLKSSGNLLGENELNLALNSRQDWPPQLALLMAFLDIFTYAQQDLNELTRRHLRYYYEEVLRLQRRAARPDQVHVIFELAKTATNWLLPQGTQLDAGKSATGLPVRYAMDSEMVVNRAVVQSLKSVFVDRRSDGKAIVFRAEDAVTVKQANSPSWRPFGSPQLSLAPESRTMTETQLGFAIASPALLLSEGDRTVKLTLQLDTTDPNPPADQSISHAIQIALTGEKGWISPVVLAAQLISGTLELDLQIPVAESPVVPYNAAIHGPGFATQWPVVRCLVIPDAFQLEILGMFTVSAVQVDVAANGLKNLVLQNDQSIQPADKPVTPFGAQPLIGNNFYIGSAEAFRKSLTALSLYLEWQDPPPDFATHYNAYENFNITDSVFTTNMHLLAGKSWKTRLLFNQSLFVNNQPANIRKLEVIPSTFSTETQGSGFKRIPELGPLPAFTSQLDQGFIKLVLTGPTRDELGNVPADAPFEAFGHKSFSTVYTRQAIALSKFIPPGTPPELPKQPYSPTLKTVTLDYSATETFVPGTPNGVDQFFVQDIFGSAETGKEESARLVPVLPGQGALYIGLQQAVAPQTLSFLFQIEEGSIPGAELLEKDDLRWSYLAGNHWQPLTTGDILEDATDILQKPGLIRVNLGVDASSDVTLMPAGMHWVRAAVARRADGAGALQALYAQAARATLVEGSEPVPAQTLAAHTISRLATKVAAVKTVRQDYPSFNGLAPETDSDFFRRINERLRHRNRAVNTWDFERLVLEGFPDIFKIKCLPYTDEANEIKPGQVKIVIVPDWRRRPGGDPLQPRANLAYLRGIETYLLDQYQSPFAQINVTNPAYQTLLVDCKVAFRAGFDPGFYTVQLEEEIRRFLSPWAYEEGQDIIFGGKVYKSELLAFVEGRPYVDYLADFQVYHRFDGSSPDLGIGCMTIGIDFIVGATPRPTIGDGVDTIGTTIGVDFVIGNPVEVATTTRPDAILVSNNYHRIEPLQADSFACSGATTIGIGQMIIGLDFIPIS